MLLSVRRIKLPRFIFGLILGYFCPYDGVTQGELHIDFKDRAGLLTSNGVQTLKDSLHIWNEFEVVYLDFIGPSFDEVPDELLQLDLSGHINIEVGSISQRDFNRLLSKEINVLSLRAHHSMVDSIDVTCRTETLFLNTPDLKHLDISRANRLSFIGFDRCLDLVKVVASSGLKSLELYECGTIEIPVEIELGSIEWLNELNLRRSQFIIQSKLKRLNVGELHLDLDGLKRLIELPRARSLKVNKLYILSAPDKLISEIVTEVDRVCSSSCEYHNLFIHAVEWQVQE